MHVSTASLSFTEYNLSKNRRRPQTWPCIRTLCRVALLAYLNKVFPCVCLAGVVFSPLMKFVDLITRMSRHGCSRPTWTDHESRPPNARLSLHCSTRPFCQLNLVEMNWGELALLTRLLVPLSSSARCKTAKVGLHNWLKSVYKARKGNGVNQTNVSSYVRTNTHTDDLFGYVSSRCIRVMDSVFISVQWGFCKQHFNALSECSVSLL